jgi:hypothetical protein
MVDLNDWNRWATIRWNLLEAARFLPAPVFTTIQTQLGGTTIPSVAPIESLRRLPTIPHGDDELLAVLVSLETLGRRHAAPPRLWKALQEAAGLLGQAAIRDRMTLDLMEAVERRAAQQHRAADSLSADKPSSS